MTFFYLPGPETRRLVQVDGHEVEVRAVVETVVVGVPIGGGCVNDSAADVICWRAEHRGRVALASTPEAAARLVLIQ